MGIWVDTDFGFDDLWALLLLRHLNVEVQGVSLVAGNTALPQVIKNATASKHTFKFNWSVFEGAEKPLKRAPETAERILGKSGMPSRGLQLQDYPEDQTKDQQKKVQSSFQEPNAAVEAMALWLNKTEQAHILALGPLTNIALLLEHYPEATKNLNKLTWMGGSAGRGNHSEFSEYNAIADPDALAAVAASQIPFRMIDLELCRQVTFTESDMPQMQGINAQLLSDLLGGYLDIAISRGRLSMAIYDPIAALTIASGELFNFDSGSLYVHLTNDSRYGQTVFNPPRSSSAEGMSQFEFATRIDHHTAHKLCMDALANA